MEKLTIKLYPENISDLENELRKKSGIKGKIYHKIIKKSLDCRNKADIHYLLSVLVDKKPIEDEKEELFSTVCPSEKIAVIGGGPAGLFCAYEFAKFGLKPLVIERGSSVDERKAKIDYFNVNKRLDENCNVQFGEGGAGTFSDGKLTTQINSPYCRQVLDTFAFFGAAEEIKYSNKPHIGSDVLPTVVKNMRNKIISLGGEFLFDTLFENFKSENGKIKSVLLKNLKSGEIKTVCVSELVLCIGHSSRDTLTTLLNNGVLMEKKDFATGVRIEHLQKDIDISQYGEKNIGRKLPPSDYKLVSHACERSGYTFCMCPGGFVINASSEDGGLVTNGMSNYARDNQNANSALLFQVGKEDFSFPGVLGGVEFQRQLERKAFLLGGGDFKAPVQLVGDFLKNKKSVNIGKVSPTFPTGYSLTNLNEIFDEKYLSVLKSSICDMGKRLKGFDSYEAVLTGVETRTSSPVRIIRNDNFSSPNFSNLYPCGEGAGYSGGIASSAVDGIKTAKAIAEKYRR